MESQVEVDICIVSTISQVHVDTETRKSKTKRKADAL